MRADDTADPGPFRAVALVVTVLAFAFVAVAVAVQFGGGNSTAVLTVPLVLAVPAVVGAVYWLVRRRR